MHFMAVEDWLVSAFLKDVARVHDSLRAVMEPTPLQRNAYLSELHNADIWLKREDLTPVRSYKLRGAYSFITDSLREDASRSLFVCASAGNHAQGFAMSCKLHGKKGVIFMPVTTPQQKIAKTASFGAPNVEIRLSGDRFDDANHAAYTYCREEGGIMVPPFNDPKIILGQATVGKEIAEYFAPSGNPDLVVLPVGGGGLSAGVCRYLKECGWNSDFVFAEPDKAPSLKRSLEAGQRVELNEMDSFVDGAAVSQIGKHPFEHLARYSSDQVLLVPTGGLCGTILDMLNTEGIVLEPAGALTIDALNRLPAENIRGRTIVCIVSGGNFDFERLPEVKERALKFSGLKKYFIIQFPQRPGALRDFLELLGPDDDIVRFEYLKKSSRNFGSVLLGIETSSPKNFEALEMKLNESAVGWQDITDDETIGTFIL